MTKHKYEEQGLTKSRCDDIHEWIKKKYGIADRCESAECRGTSRYFDWAVKHNKPYERNRDNFMMLCRSCHSRYDYKHSSYRRQSNLITMQKLHKKLLTPDQVKEIRRLYAKHGHPSQTGRFRHLKFMTHDDLAKRFGVNKSTIRRVIARILWKDI